MKRALLILGHRVAICLFIAFALFPLFWLLKVSITPNDLLYSEGVRLWPSRISFEHFAFVLKSSNFPLFFRNSLIVSLSTAAVVTVIAVFGGYAFSRFAFRGKSWIVALLLVTQMFPLVMLIAPMFRMLAPLGLTALVERRPKALSGGQRQRVAMGRAIVRDPQAFLFHEPLSNLDARLREHMRAEIKKLHARLGATSIYVTHDQIEAMTLADRIVAMEGGVIQQIGTPLDLYERPANRFVAGFIGSPAMNFLTGRVERASAGPSLDLGGGRRLPLPAGLTGAADMAGAELTIGIRPEHVLIGEAARTCPAGGSGIVAPSIECPIELVEPTGIGTIVHADLGGISLKAFVAGLSPLKAGQTVPLALPASHLHLFDPASGRRTD